MPVYEINKKNIANAAAEIKRGGIVAFPTETVYGLGADAFNPEAVARIFEAKGRPADNPLIVHIADKADIFKIVKELSPAAQKLLDACPAPLTLVCKKNEEVPYIVTAGLETVAVRIPESKPAIEFIAACGTPVAAPSANTSTRPSPTKAMHVYDDLGGKVSIILDGGDCEFGLESTVVDVTGDKAVILRSGSFTAEQLREYGVDVCFADKIKNVNAECAAGKNSPPPSPGMKYKHYSPAIPLIAVRHDAGMRDRAAAKYSELAACGKKAVIISADGIYSGMNCINLGADKLLFSRRLFAVLRECEKEYDIIIAECVGEEGLGIAINNRLLKACGGNII